MHCTVQMITKKLLNKNVPLSAAEKGILFPEILMEILNQFCIFSPACLRRDVAFLHQVFFKLTWFVDTIRTLARL